MDVVFERRISPHFVKAKTQQRKKNELQDEARLKDKDLYRPNGKFKTFCLKKCWFWSMWVDYCPPPPPRHVYAHSSWRWVTLSTWLIRDQNVIIREASTSTNLSTRSVAIKVYNSLFLTEKKPYLFPRTYLELFWEHYTINVYTGCFRWNSKYFRRWKYGLFRVNKFI
jgi:hypothetical protein